MYYAEFNGVCSTEFHVLDSNKVSNEYLANFLRTNLVVNQTKYLMSGNTLPRLQTEDIENLLIPIVSPIEEEKINSIMRSVFAQKQKNEAQSEKLLSSIDEYLLNELGIKLPELPESNLKNRIFTRTFKQISNKRFDPFFHQTYFQNALQIIEDSVFKTTPLKNTISNYTKGIEVGSAEYLSEGIPFVRVADIDDFSINLEDSDKKISESKYLELKNIINQKLVKFFILKMNNWILYNCRKRKKTMYLVVVF